ncbi:DNA-binding response regulator [Microbacterium sp. B35-04]|uniref:response regulator n=1 Tax=Microbacterium sp. B35-04 TaxID=1961716 RepID=UPI0013D3036F|nr:response regulator transcription factor [Microbacterium sp. B35-04]KAF2411735.1 DNA-binding response regulator [Microbacterium sp. B35-04]
MSDAIRVLLVDDHAVMRAGFRMILESAGDIAVVGEAATGVEAVAAASALRPDVICMDVQMPDMDGLEATRRITRDGAVDAAVVVVTTFDRDDYLFDALAAGASGFLLKNAGPEELIAAVRVAAAGDALLAPEVTRRVIARFAQSEIAAPAAAALRQAQRPGSAQGPASAARDLAPSIAEPVEAPVVELTEREGEVLRLVAQAMSNAEIAQRLYIGEATVKTHVSNVLQKLGARDRVAAVVYAHRHGLT